MSGLKGEIGQKGSKGDSGGREGVSLLVVSSYLFMLIEGYYVIILTRKFVVIL